MAGPLGEEREADLVNRRKVYNVRFYSLSIIQSWKKQKGEGKEDKSEQRRREGEEEAKSGGGSDVRRCVFRLWWMLAEGCTLVSIC